MIRIVYPNDFPNIRSSCCGVSYLTSLSSPRICRDLCSIWGGEKLWKSNYPTNFETTLLDMSDIQMCVHFNEQIKGSLFSK